jgi:hypothetical protein
VSRRRSSHAAELIDVSLTGAKVLCHGLLQVGEELVLKAEGVEVFGKIVRADGDTIGIEFYEALSPGELDSIQREAKAAALMRVSPEQKRAIDAWKSGRLD